MIPCRNRFSYIKSSFPSMFYAEKVLTESSGMNNMHRSSKE